MFGAAKHFMRFLALFHVGLPTYHFLLSSGDNLGFYQSSFFSHVPIVRSFAPPWVKPDLAARLKAKNRESRAISRGLQRLAPHHHVFSHQ